MSAFPNNTSATAPISRPKHHLHSSNEPLPGARGAEPAVDYSKDTLERAPNAAFNEQPTHISHNAGATTHNPMRHHGQSADIGTHDHGHNPARRIQDTATERGNTTGTHTKSLGPTCQGRNAFTEDRSLGVVTPTGGGGVAIGGKDNHAGLGDKIVGKTQKVAGKITDNAGLYEKGELRETGGKVAVRGEARAAHD
ncbi:hypothetical protein DXG03_001554 [Asterophora parasitica]|uniref:Uncharacterized protein n=1 Tax=Asterophora parasitica TaxID=117018 RepID=A0A9P7G6N8_9AGAR|nr:hypothetical protein DXG03_001554 [Asterophora parasitica]